MYKYYENKQLVKMSNILKYCFCNYNEQFNFGLVKIVCVDNFNDLL